MTSVRDLIIAGAAHAAAVQRQDGSFPPGRNGPYNDPETPVRNTAHWIQVCVMAHTLTGDAKYRVAAERGIQYMLSSDARPMNASFWCRTNPDKDFCNGLIGQAWAIEGLVGGGRALGLQDALDLAATVFLLHPYDKRRAGWRCLNVDGSYGPLDLTFNHQLWFAAAGSLIADDDYPDVAEQVLHFMDALPSHLALYRDGLIQHQGASFLRHGIREILTGMAARMLRSQRARRAARAKAIGYHAFNTYALALLHRSFPAHRIWKDSGIARALQYLQSASFLKAVETAPYGIEYNPPGLEAAFSISEFTPARTDEVEHWLCWQIDRTMDPQTRLLTRRAADDKTAAARIYEATRLAARADGP